MNAPQALTQRYVRNLLRAGKNRDFEILTISREIQTVDELCIGIFYRSFIKGCRSQTIIAAVGLTPAQAVTRTLERFGCTFR